MFKNKIHAPIFKHQIKLSIFVALFVCGFSLAEVFAEQINISDSNWQSIRGIRPVVVAKSNNVNNDSNRMVAKSVIMSSSAPTPQPTQCIVTKSSPTSLTYSQTDSTHGGMQASLSVQAFQADPYLETADNYDYYLVYMGVHIHPGSGWPTYTMALGQDAKTGSALEVWAGISGEIQQISTWFDPKSGTWGDEGDHSFQISAQVAGNGFGLGASGPVYAGSVITEPSTNQMQWYLGMNRPWPIDLNPRDRKDYDLVFLFVARVPEGTSLNISANALYGCWGGVLNPQSAYVWPSVSGQIFGRHLLQTSATPSDGGYITPSSGLQWIDTKIPVTPHSNSGYLFGSWLGDVPSGHGTDNPLQIYTLKNMSLTGQFLKLTTIEVQSDPVGVLISDPDGGSNTSYLRNKAASSSYWLQAPSTASSRPFTGWQKNGSSYSTNRRIDFSFPLSGTDVYKATYAQIYTLSLSKSGNGSVRVNGTQYSLPWSGSFTAGTNVTLEAVPDSGWQFSNWGIDLSGNANPTAIQMNGERNVTVNFAQPNMSVSSSDGLSSSGQQGGPFSPSSKDYTVQNTGSGTLSWSVSKVQNWVSLSQSSGTLGAGQSTTVTVSVNSNANSLSAGSYSDTVSFTNNTNGLGNTSRGVSLSVTTQPNMSVSPSDWLSSSGQQGGPFSPSSKTYTVTNTGGGTLSWSASKAQSWVTVSPSSGTLGAGLSTTVTVSINNNANSLSAGSYSDTVSFTNNTNSLGNTSRSVSLSVTTQPNMSVSPSDGLSSSGQQGGPFSPSSKDYTVQNTGIGTLSWSASKTQSWVTVTPSSGSLTAGQSASVTVSTNSNANGLSPNTYSDTVSFVNNTNSSGNTSRSVSLTVSTNPTISGYVRDCSSNGVGGVTVTFSNSAGSTTTLNDGSYSKQITSGWSGTATPSYLTWSFTPLNRSYSNVTSNQTNQNFQRSDCLCGPYTVGGAIFTNIGSPMTSGLADVNITLTGTGGTFTGKTSGAQGIWSIPNVPCGTYTVTPSRLCYRFEHVAGGISDGNSSITITVDADHQAANQSIQFLAIPVTCYVKSDMNWDGFVSIVGDVEPFVKVVYNNDLAWYQNHFPGKDQVLPGDCSGDGFLSIIGDVPCFVNCVYFGNCATTVTGVQSGILMAAVAGESSESKAVDKLLLPLGLASAVSMDTEPSAPKPGDVISLALWGEWSDSCIPTEARTRVNGTNIYVNLLHGYTADTSCAQALTEWSAVKDIGPLDAGTYEVYVSVYEESWDKLNATPPSLVGKITVGEVRARSVLSSLATSYTIGGAIYTDISNPLTSGLADVNVTLTGTGGTFNAKTSGAQGIWSVANVPEGTYTVTPARTGYCFEHVAGGVSDGQLSITITVNSANQAANQSIQFLATAGCNHATYTVGGAIYTDLDNPLVSGLAGVKVSVDGNNGIFDTNTAGSQGLWQIDVPEGSYEVTPSMTGKIFEHVFSGNPDSQSSVLIDVNAANQAINQSIQFLASEPNILPATNPTPANGATGVSVTTDLSWTAGSGATSHDVYFGTVSPGTFRGNQTATTYDTNTMANNTTYYWRINEKNTGGTTTGDVWSFKTVAVVAAPGKATSPTPANAATGVGVTTDLSWTAGSGATSHDVYFGTVSPGTFRGNQTGTTYDTGTMANNTTYYWRIDEKNAGGTTTGDVWSFTTVPQVTISPNGGTFTGSISVTLSCSTSGMTIRYTTNGSDPISSSTQYTSPFTVSSSCTVKARAFKGGRNGTGGDVASAIFTKVATPGKATSPTPASGATGVSVTTDLSWTAGSGATSHDVYFGTVSPGTSRGNQTATTYDTGTMANNTTYYWRIDEKNAGGTTTGDVWSFKTVAVVAAPGKATSPTPASGATGVSVTTDLSWTAGSGATSHDVYFGTVSPGTFRGNQTATTYDTGTMANNTTYYWRIDEKNAGGTTTGDIWSFTTTASVTKPTATTVAASAITANGATLNSTVNPNGSSTTIYFQYGTTKSYGSTTTSNSIGTSSGSRSQTISGLTRRTTYHFRIVATNSGGTSYGSDLTFTTR